MEKNKAFSYFILIVAVFCWSANFAVVRDLVAAGCDLNLVSFLRGILAVLFFLAPILVKRKPFRKKAVKENFIWIFGMGFFGITVFYFLSNIGLQYVDAGRSALINSINPGLIVLFSALLFKEPLTPKRIGGTILSFIGVLIVILANNQGLITHLDFNPHDLIFLGTGLCVTIYTVCNRFLADHIDYTVGLFWCFLLGTVLLFPPALPHFREIAAFSFRQWLELIYIGGICGAVCNLIFYQVMMVIGMGSCGLVNSFSPLFAVIVAWLFLGEPITLPILFGALLLVTGVSLGVNAIPVVRSENQEEMKVSGGEI